jgi:hypothetical protein
MRAQPCNSACANRLAADAIPCATDPDALGPLLELLDRIDSSMQIYNETISTIEPNSGDSVTPGNPDDSMLMSSMVGMPESESNTFSAIDLWPEETDMNEQRECPICMDDVALKDGVLLGCHVDSFYCYTVC